MATETDRGQSDRIESRQPAMPNLETLGWSGQTQPQDIVPLDDLVAAFSGDDSPFESEESSLDSVAPVTQEPESPESAAPVTQKPESLESAAPVTAKPEAPPPQTSGRRAVQRSLWLTGGAAAAAAIALVLWASGLFDSHAERRAPVVPPEQASTGRSVATAIPSRNSDPGRALDSDIGDKAVPSNTAPAAPSGPTGTLIIDAVPWGTVTDVVNSRGSQIALSDQRSTPLALSLPDDVYTITIKDPSSTVTRNLKVKVVQSRQTTVTTTFRKVDAREYFREAGLQDIQ
jgi:hypothetical protein